MKTTINLLRFSFILLMFQYGFSNNENKPLQASIQLIHASGDQALKAIDVYVNGKIFLDDFQYKSASPFISVPASTPLKIDIAPFSSRSSDESLYNLKITMAPEQIYIIVASGLVSRTGYSPFKPFKLNVFNQGQVFTSSNLTKMLVFNAVTDAPHLGLAETAFPLGVIARDVAFNQFFGYMTFRPKDYQLNALNASQLAPRPGPNDNPIIATFSLPLESLKFQGKAITLIAMGFLNPDANSTLDSFGLYIAVPAGGALIPLTQLASSVQGFAAAGIVMYPNPSSSYINIGIPLSYNKASARILDFSGREIRRIDDVDRQINIADLTNGMYFLNIELDDQVYMQKFYVQK